MNPRETLEVGWFGQGCEAGQTLALQVTLRLIGAHKKNQKNIMKVGFHSLGDRLQFVKNLKLWNKTQKSKQFMQIFGFLLKATFDFLIFKLSLTNVKFNPNLMTEIEFIGF